MSAVFDQREYLEAWRKANAERVKATQAAWYRANAEREKQKKAAWRKAHPDKEKARCLAYRTANLQKRSAASAEWRKAHPERARKICAAWRKADPARAEESDRRNHRAHPEKGKRAHARRRGRERAAVGNFTSADVRIQFSAQGGLCFYCSAPLHKYHLEHRVPLARGGSNWPSNIVCACPRCNLRKGARTDTEFSDAIRRESVHVDLS